MVNHCNYYFYSQYFHINAVLTEIIMRIKLSSVNELMPSLSLFLSVCEPPSPCSDLTLVSQPPADDPTIETVSVGTESRVNSVWDQKLSQLDGGKNCLITAGRQLFKGAVCPIKTLSSGFTCPGLVSETLKTFIIPYSFLYIFSVVVLVLANKVQSKNYNVLFYRSINLFYFQIYFPEKYHFLQITGETESECQTNTTLRLWFRGTGWKQFNINEE